MRLRLAGLALGLAAWIAIGPLTGLTETPCADRLGGIAWAD